MAAQATLETGDRTVIAAQRKAQGGDLLERYNFLMLGQSG